MMRTLSITGQVVLAFLLFAPAGCDRRNAMAAPQPQAATQRQGKVYPLAEKRQAFKTKLTRHLKEDEPVPDPPDRLFRIISYDSPAGKLAAYFGPEPKDGKRHPAIIWMIGGFSNSIGDTPWRPAAAENDQSAGAFRKAGIVMMYPSLRGGNKNPGNKEGFLGEVDDVLAAADWLAKQHAVDPARIYLGGHSTGGTLALLVAESSDRFRAVFAFGPVANVASYGPEELPFDVTDREEIELRSPGRWLDSIHTPTYLFEGTKRPSNIRDLQAIAAASHNPALHAYPVTGASHFSILAPVTRLIAAKIVRDTGSSANIEFTEAELDKSVAR
jgi:acetyl esterase/lipase